MNFSLSTGELDFIQSPVKHDHRGRVIWNTPAKRLFKSLYPKYSNEYIAAEFQTSVASIQSQATKMGLKKTHEFKKKHGERVGFPKGHIPPHKGKRIDLSPERTRFKKGMTPQNWEPVDKIKMMKRSRVWEYHIKLANNYWKRLAAYKYLKYHNMDRVPQGKGIYFKNGNHKDVRISNLIMAAPSAPYKDKSRVEYGPGFPKSLKRKCERYSKVIKRAYKDYDGYIVELKPGYINKYLGLSIIMGKGVRSCFPQFQYIEKRN